MAPPRFDPERFLELWAKHPDWTHAQLAAALTRDNKTKAAQDQARFGKIVTKGTIQTWIHRHKDEVFDQRGIDLTRGRQSSLVRELIAYRGRIAEDEHRANVPLKRLRVLARLAEGLECAPEDAAKAQAWERRRRERREVVDLDDTGHPFIRDAEPWELDDNGELRSLVAQPEP